jgi:hypothetical protein
MKQGCAEVRLWVKDGPRCPETPLPFCPEQRTFSAPLGMSQNANNGHPALFNHLVGHQYDGFGYSKTKRFCSL